MRWPARRGLRIILEQGYLPPINMRKTSVTIRYATEADSALLADLGARTFKETFAADNSAENIAAYLADSFSPEKQSQELAEPSSYFFIAEVDGIPVGNAQLNEREPLPCVTGSRPVELVRIYVLKDWIGYGVGAALMQACINEAQRRGYETLWLGVWERNYRAQEFYRKWGFVEVGSHIFPLGDDPQTDFLMQRPVNPPAK
jgi:GNAT superfamily N-acetyltransferase